MPDDSPTNERDSGRLVADGGLPTTVVLGDSVAWGQGLSHGDKYASKFYEYRSGNSASLPRDAVKAHSGAVIGSANATGARDVMLRLDDAGNLAGTTRQGRHEFPYGPFSLYEQLDRLPTDYEPGERPGSLDVANAYDPAESPDVVLVTGGINDIGGGSIADPLAGPENTEKAVREHCYKRMKPFLQDVHQRFPNATIVVTGYHLILSTGPDGSDVVSMEALAAGLTVLFGLFGVTGGAVFAALWGAAEIAEGRAAVNLEYFYQQSTHYLRKAVTEVDNANPGTSVLFASPDFDRENAAAADDPWVFSPGARGDRSVRPDRDAVCEAMAEPPIDNDSVKCPVAPSLHPNADGAAGMARREQRWKLKRKLAQHNQRIQDQKMTLAEDKIEIVEQEKEIAQLRTEHARDMVNFHQNKFFDTEMYRWMSGVLKRVYRYYLQQAASVARLAQRQLAFERQSMPRQFILTDYWELPNDDGSSDEQGEERRGITGSVRLRQDITELDQWEFRTDERKLQVEKTISLSDVDPIALQQFRETGVLPFETTLEQFNYDYPGQFMRLIEDVSVDIVALTPPDEGISATLRTSGTSRVVVGDTLFREKEISRQPETVVLNQALSPENKDRIRLKPEQGERLRPFENMGVAADWELRMPKAANDFEYATIQDVRVTISYSAFESYQYQRQVQSRIGTQRSRQRAFSLNDDFADAWYDLHNPEGTATPRTVEFEVDPTDFPATLSDLEMGGVQLYLVGPTSENEREDLQDIEFTLRLRRPDGTTAEATERPVDGIVSSDKFSGTAPTGTWELTVTPPDTGPVSEPFQDGPIDDVLLILDLEGHVPGWPE